MTGWDVRPHLPHGNWAFCVAGPATWNCLPLDIRSTPTLSTFKNMLKTHLCSCSYFTNYLFPYYEQRTLYSALVVTLAMLRHLINHRFIIIIIIIISVLLPVVTCRRVTGRRCTVRSRWTLQRPMETRALLSRCIISTRTNQTCMLAPCVRSARSSRTMTGELTFAFFWGVIIITRILLECRTANSFENTEQGQNSATRTQQCGSQDRDLANRYVFK